MSTFVRASKQSTFVAIDFETANVKRDSACAVGLVRVERGRITAREHLLVRPPSRWFQFTNIHGITWQHVEDAPTWKEVWREVKPLMAGCDFLAAHNAPFDQSVLEACCARWDVPVRLPPFVCTLQLARKRWDLKPAKLPDVARFLGLKLRHHDALSDAEACARIVLAA